MKRITKKQVQEARETMLLAEAARDAASARHTEASQVHQSLVIDYNAILRAYKEQEGI